MAQVMASEGVNLYSNLESPLSSPARSDPSTPTGCRSPTGYTTSAHNSPEGSPVLRRKKRAKKVLSSCEEEKEEETMTGDKVAEVSVKGGKGRVLWRPSRSFEAGASERAVPPWAEPDAQAPPPPSNFYASAPSATMTTHIPVRPTMGMATGVQADPNPTHFNRPSPGASPVPIRKCLFRMNAPTRSLSSESLHKTLPWVAKRSEPPPPPAGEGQETDRLCPMIMTGDSRSRLDQMRGRASTRSASLPRVGGGGGESVPSQTVAGGVGNLPAGRGMQEAPPQPRPTQSETAGGRGASEPQNVPRPQSHSQAGIRSSPHIGADPPDRADVGQHPPGRMVSAKPTAEAKAAATSALPSQQPEQSSPTPWRKMRPAAAPTESTPPPEKSSPTPWRKNVRSPDTGAKAAPSVQKQQESTKDNVSAASASESDTADASSASSAKTQDAPWRRATSHQTLSAESSSSQSVSSVTESKSTSFKQTQVIQTSHISVGVSSEEASKITASTHASGAPTPPPTPPSVPSAKAREPRTQSPSFHRPRHPAAKPRSISIGDIEAQYLTPIEDQRHRKMPAEGGEILAATAPEEAKQPVKNDDALFDPWCDPKHPRVINFQDVSAAAFKIKSGIMNTPCTLSHMSTFTDMEIYFKKEFNQYTGSFKERGARYTLLMLTEEQRRKGVIAASAGNHALALSYHGQDLGIPVTVVMPLVAPIMKVQACRQYGANIIVRGKDIGECREIALRMSKEQGLLYINGYDHPHILAGQGTMGLEIVEQVKDIDAVVIPVGGGGLIAGVALAVKALYPHVKVIGVESERCASFSEAMKAGRPVYVAAETTLADGLAVPLVGVNAFATASKLVDKVVQVREEWIAIAILRLVECEKAVVEGAGATALAAILAGELPELKGKRIVIPLCGGNIDTTVLGRCLERGLAADGRLVKFTVTVSDRPGGIAELTRLLANLGVSIKDMMHERAWIKNDIFSVEVKVIAETRDHEHSLELRTALESQYRRLRFANPDHIHDDC
ncbi:uncharacterized protein LOC135206650 isoform X2 [Macrobrachium nipponense]|uniref:uncharacterized protein LOC135206650 isoform X2 n=1 Tax=Macrobrachium nipponense TaxID=159736 RepID=UPI0030C84C7B